MPMVRTDGLSGRWSVGRSVYGHVITKFSPTGRLLQFLTHGASLIFDSKRFSGRQNVSPDNISLFETLHTTPRRHISLAQAVILSFTSNFFAPVAANNMRPQVRNITTVFSPLSLTLTDLSENTYFLKRLLKVTSVI